MLRDAADVWWPKIHREIVEKTKNCRQCRMAGKNFKCVKLQKEFEKIPIPEKPNNETAIDSARSFQNATNGKKYLLVSVDQNSGWPEALVLPNPTTEKDLELLEEHIAQNEIPKRLEIPKRPKTRNFAERIL